MKIFIKQALLSFLFLISLNFFSQSIESAWMKKYLKECYVDTGTYLPDVTLYEKNGAVKALKNYRGKLVYIDI